MNFEKIREAARAAKVYDDTTLNDRILKNNKWTKWTSRGGPLGPGVESVLSKSDINEALSYGDKLIQNDDGTPNVDGQVKIITDAKAGNRTAINYVWLQMQDVILDKFWHNRIGASDKRRRRMGHNQEVWNEWLTLCWADLSAPPHSAVSPEVAGISALDGFHLEKSAPFAAFSNLATRFGFLLRNAASVINDEEHRKGAKGTPFSDDGDASVLEYDAKYMDSKQSEEGSHAKSTEDEVFESIFRDSKEAEGFFEAFTDIVSSDKSQAKAPAGTKMLEPFLYFLGEPFSSDETGHSDYAKNLGDLFKRYPKEDNSALYKYVKYTFPTLLEEWGISMEEFLSYANDQTTNERLRKIVKAAI
jgi:hypothetical protein